MKTLTELAHEINYYANTNFDIRPIWEDNTLKYLMYVVTELAEAMESWRDNNREHFGEELADAVIRIFDMTTALGINIELEIEKKMEKNWLRSRNHGRAQV